MVGKENILKGTTTVGILCKDGVILAADKRATAGNLIADKNAQKIYEIGENMAVTTAGGVSDNQLLIKLIRAEIKLKNVRTNRNTSVGEAANLLSSFVYGNIRKPSMLPGITHLVMAGMDEEGYHLYDIYPDGSLNKCKDYVSSGSGSTMAYGVLETLYEDGINVDEGINLAIKSLNASLRRDSASGNGFVILVINKDGTKKIIDKDIDVFLEK
ncbi:MAG: proteasome subunit beta [Candidatus Woesearchaeota archaeon]